MSQIPYINIPKVNPNRSYPYLDFQLVNPKIFYAYLKRSGFDEYINPEQIPLPVRATTYSAGYDFTCPITIKLEPDEMVVIPSGVKCKIEIPGIYLELHVRSSLSLKGLSIGSGSTSIIDADYYNNEKNEGMILLPIKNTTDKDIVIEKGQKIVQGIFTNYYIIDNDKPISAKRSGGVGSTGR